ncbi:MAG: FkbM family methyltransferase [Chloroflexi bacterium]|nr:FkbM family methyltransferase [Chloroflexota bacterium]
MTTRTGLDTLEEALKCVVDYGLHIGLLVPPLWSFLEGATVWAGHRWPDSRITGALAFRLREVSLRWSPSAISRVAMLPTGARLALSLQDYYHYRLYFTGLFEPGTTALVRKLLRPNDVFIDIGANIGFYSCTAAALQARVHAFEPNPSLSRFLEQSRVLNGWGERLTVNTCAVASTAGRAEFFLSTNQENSGLSSLLPLDHLSTAEKLVVPTTTLDAYCSAHGIDHVRLIKIDVEGGERDVLTGAARVLQDVRPDAVICELSSFGGGSKPADVLHLLEEAGYVPYEIAENGNGLLRTYSGMETETNWGPPNLCFLRGSPAELGLISAC